jgi:hypothetical protein
MFDIEKAKKRLNLEVSEIAFLLGVRGQPDVAIQKWLKKPAMAGFFCWPYLLTFTSP